MWLLVLGMQLALADDGTAFAAWAAGQHAPDTVPEVASGYRFAAQDFQAIAGISADRPGVVEVEQIGTSVQGRPLWAFHIEDPATPPERSVLVFGGIHALEWIGTEVATDLALDLVEHPVPGVRVTVIPLLNPDGRARVEQDLLEGRNAYRRGNGRNVDLNRDFSVNTEVRSVWAHLIPGYYRHSEKPLSQPESRALDTLAAREKYDRSASLHAFGGYFYYPWAGRYAHPPDEQDFVTLGQAMENAQGAHAYRTKELSHWGFFFRAQGAELDHLYGKYGTRAFLIEFTRSGLSPWHPRAWKSDFRLYNPADPREHRAGGVRAVRELVRHPEVPGELTHPAGTAR